MSLSACPKCWDTPCECGHEYKDWTPERLARFIVAITQERDIIERHKIIEYADHLMPDAGPFGGECMAHIILPPEAFFNKES